jgi:hypothetical protein
MLEKLIPGQNILVGVGREHVKGENFRLVYASLSCSSKRGFEKLWLNDEELRFCQF